MCPMGRAVVYVYNHANDEAGCRQLNLLKGMSLDMLAKFSLKADQYSDLCWFVCTDVLIAQYVEQIWLLPSPNETGVPWWKR